MWCVVTYYDYVINTEHGSFQHCFPYSIFPAFCPLDTMIYNITSKGTDFGTCLAKIKLFFNLPIL